MNAKPVIWSLTAASLLYMGSVAVTGTESQQHVNSHDGSGRGPVVDAVRRAIERFRDVEQAINAGYAQFQGCVSGPEEGAMGVHYANFSLFGDNAVDLENPEVLVYEPIGDRLKLVAAEYVIPAAPWDAAHDESDKPNLMGNLFHFAPGPNRYGSAAFYELHVWAWKTNPRGPFADWNPNVSCRDWRGPSF